MANHQFTIIQSPAELDHALEQYHRVYAKSWKPTEPHDAFIDAICHQYSQQGLARIGLLTSGETCVAAQIWFVIDEVAYIFKLAYDPAFRELSPGTLLSSKLMKHAVEIDKVKSINFLQGNDAYKADWMTQHQSYNGIRAYDVKWLQKPYKTMHQLLKGRGRST